MLSTTNLPPLIYYNKWLINQDLLNYWALMQNYNCMLANIWYLILLIQSFNTILHIFMFYKQCDLADFWGRKDSTVCIIKQTVYRSFHVHSAMTHASLRLRLAQIGALSGSQNAIFVKHTYTWECWLIMFRIRVCVRYPIYYIGKYTVIGILYYWGGSEFCISPNYCIYSAAMLYRLWLCSRWQTGRFDIDSKDG